jgi:phospholipase/lecithinase/hemolysin
MGYKRSPQPFLFLNRHKSSFQTKKFRGANFASGGSGLLNITSKSLKVVPMSEQVNQFLTVRRKLAGRMGESSTEYMLSKSVFIISIGSNDIIEYFDTNNPMPKEQFITALMASYESQIKALYKLGARKFGVISVLPMGCCPAERQSNATGGCREAMNVFSLRFYRELDSLLSRISPKLSGFKYSLGNTYRMVMNVIQNPSRYNMTNVESACCGSGRLNAEQYCNASSNLCENRNEYAFWDGSHPTQTASRLAARALYNSELRYATPINFRELAQNT